MHVAESMSRNDYEAISDKLIIEGEEMSEIGLFLGGALYGGYPFGEIKQKTPSTAVEEAL